MRRTSIRSRVLAGVTALAIAGAGSLALAGSAGAAQAAVTVATSNPFIPVNTANAPVGNIVLTEAAAGDVTAGQVCVDLLTSTAAWDGAAPDPTISDNGHAVAVVANPDVVSDTRARFDVTTAATGSAATYTFGGLRLDTDGDTGPVVAEVGDCTGNNDQYEPSIKVAFVGEITREAGADRYATAQQIAERTYASPCGDAKVDDVVIARGDNFPDALAASYLAGVLDAPILLVAPNSVPNETLAALKNLGASGVIVVGGEAAISAEVYNFLDNRSSYDCDGIQNASNLNADRIFGVDRFATARNVLLHAGTVGLAGTYAPAPETNTVDCGTDLRTAIVASGENFPDALAAGPLAFAGSDGCGDGNPIPLLLTRAGSLPDITATGLNAHNIQQVILMGGTSAVSAGVASAILDLPTVTNVTRVAGPDRQGTAVELTEKILQHDTGDWVLPNRAFFVTRPDTFPDALAAAPLAGTVHGPLFLSASTSSLGTTASNGIKAYPSDEFFHRAVLLGGTAALTAQVETDTGAAIAGQAN